MISLSLYIYIYIYAYHTNLTDWVTLTNPSAGG